MPARALPTGEGDLADLARVILAMRPDELERFVLTLNDPADVAVVEQIVADYAAEGWRTDPATMAAFLDPKFQTYRYVRYLSRKFTQLVDGTSPRQIWNLQGRLGKSTLIQWGCTWVFDRHPEAKFIIWSYGKDLAVENAIGIRDRLNDHADVLRCSLRRDRQRQDRFVTDAGGGVIAAGRGSVARGFGVGAGGGLVIDDPFKDWQEAHSEATRNKVWNQYRGTLLDRFDDEQGWTLAVHHRVHKDDFTGRVMEDAATGGLGWDVTALPSIAPERKPNDRPDPLGREPGEPIEPKRFSVAFHQQQRKSMGSYLASALIDQAPTAEEGTAIKRAWFRLWGTEENPGPDHADEKLSSWDLKLKNKEEGDYVVGQIWWRVGPDYYLRDQVRGKFDHATTTNAIALLAVRHPDVLTHAIEQAGSYDDVVPQLRKPAEDYEVSEEMATRLGMTAHEVEQVQALRRRGMSGLVGHPVTEGSKPVRARTFIVGPAEAGNVHVPAYAEFTPELLDEAAGFPGGANDDQVDAMSQALQRLSRLGASVTAPTGRTPTPRPGQAPTLIRTTGRSAPSAVSLPVRRNGTRRR